MKLFKRALVIVAAALTFVSQQASAEDGVTVNVPASANPYLAGAPDGAMAACDTAPGTPPYVVSPPSVPGLITDPNAQETFYFYATGSAEHGGGTPTATPDGTSFWNEGADRGISSCIYPLDALVGVFLDDSTPMPGDTAPSGLDFSDGTAGASGFTPVPGGKDYTEIAPQLRQVFFIGNGLTSGGVGQKVKAPLGATRLFLASTDGCGWYNNNGGYSVRVAKTPITSGPPPPPHGGLSDTIFRVNGSANPGSNLTDTVLHFSAQQNGTPDDLIVQVQMNTVPDNNLNDWVNLDNGAGKGYMVRDQATGQFVLSTTNYPNTSSVYFRALSKASGYPESKSNIIGPFNLSYGQGHLSPTTLYITANGPGGVMNFRADVGVDQAAMTLSIQTTSTPDDDASWVGLNDGRAGQMNQYTSPTSFYLDSKSYPEGAPVYFRAVATAPGFVKSLSNYIGLKKLVTGNGATLDIVPPFPQPGSQSGLDAQHPIIAAMGALNMGVTNIASPDGRPITKVGLVYDGGTIETWTGAASGLMTQYLTNVPGDHVIKAYAVDDRGIPGYAQPVFIRIKPENGKVFNLVASGDWSSPANWRDENNEPGVPGPNDMAFIGNANATINGPVSAFIVTLAGGSITGGGDGTSLTITKNFTIADGMLKNLNLTIGSDARLILVGDNPVPASGTVINNGTVRITGQGGFVPVPNGTAMRTNSVTSPNGFFDGIGAFFKNAGTFLVNLPKTIAVALSRPSNPVPIPPERGVYASKFENSGHLLSENGLGLVTDNGSGLITNDGATAISYDGAKLLDQNGRIISRDGAGAISHDGSSLITNDGGSAPASTTRPTTAEAIAASPGFVQNGGELNLSGFNVQSSIVLNGGTLTGSGVIVGSLTNSAGFVSPGHSAGTIAVTGDFTQEAGGTFIAERGGKNIGENDQLQVSGTANLGGTLHVKTINGFIIDPADTFSPLGFTAVTGSFSNTGDNAQVTLNANGAQVSLNPAAPQPQSGQPLNIATRLAIQSGDNALFAGFIVTGASGSTKKVMIRGIGPSLANFGVAGTISDPLLELHNPDGSVVVNDNWQEGDTSQIPDGFAPADSRESVIVATLAPGNYSAVVKGAHGETGVGLAEVYDLDPASSGKLANIATRGFVQTGDNVLIGGFIVGGTEPAKILVRAISPSLAAFGVPNTLPATTLELHDSNGFVISNEGWRNTQESEITATTIPPTNDNEAAILATLVPGNYTAVVRGKNGTTGIAVVEAYNLQ